MNWNLFLLDGSMVIGGDTNAPATNTDTSSSDSTAAGTTTATDTGATDQSASNSLFSGPFVILIYVVIIGAMYFFMVRPQRKRDKEAKAMQAAIKTGDDIVTSGGLYGRVISVGEDCFVIEFGTNKGIRVPVRKSDILGVKSPKIGSTSTLTPTENT